MIPSGHRQIYGTITYSPQTGTGWTDVISYLSLMLQPLCTHRKPIKSIAVRAAWKSVVNREQCQQSGEGHITYENSPTLDLYNSIGCMKSNFQSDHAEGVTGLKIIVNGIIDLYVQKDINPTHSLLLRYESQVYYHTCFLRKAAPRLSSTWIRRGYSKTGAHSQCGYKSSRVFNILSLQQEQS